jgi:ubiquinone/menaquinone biosynthesis C-methylase UbiE
MRTLSQDIANDALLPLLPSDVERQRYSSLREILATRMRLFAGRRVLDFGASWGTSAIALARSGAREVIGVEPDSARIEKGHTLIAQSAPHALISLYHVPDTSTLPFADGEFPFILANGVFEHVPQPRDRYLSEVWRVLRRGGHLMIVETPNKYFPKDSHTTYLWFNHWLPSAVAHRRAVRRERFDAERTDWASSGWRGCGYFELVRSLRHYRLVPSPPSRLRHRALVAVGLPAELIDPWPIWLFQKKA